MPSGKREAAAMTYLGSLAAAQPAEIRERRAAAEEAYQTILNRLGAPGTYSPTALPAEPGTTTGGTTTGGTATAPTGGVLKQEKVQEASARLIDPRYVSQDKLQTVTKVDPEAMMAGLEGSAQFRIASKLVAESEQMLNREGPLWDEMVKNTQLPIIEGAGAMARENAEALRRAMARGGSARSNAFKAVQEIRSQERINTAKYQQLSNSRLELDKWARDNARTNLAFAQNWAANQGGIRESFNTAMDRASELMVSKALPVMFETTSRAAEWRHSAHQKNRDKVKKWVMGTVGVASLALGGLGALGLTGGVLGAASTALAPYAGGLAQTGIQAVGGAIGGTTPTPAGRTFELGG